MPFIIKFFNKKYEFKQNEFTGMVNNKVIGSVVTKESKRNKIYKRFYTNRILEGMIVNYMFLWFTMDGESLIMKDSENLPPDLFPGSYNIVNIL